MKKVPNILCLIRIILIPFILVFLLENPISDVFSTFMRLLISGIIFALAMFTDFVDGYIARKYDAVTNFGKFLDPIADKMLVLSVLLAFVDLNIVSAVPVIIILAREFLVTGLRLGAMNSGVVVAANIWGKLKTILQGVSIGASFIILLIAAYMSPELDISREMSEFPSILIWISAIFTAISAISYYNSCKQYLKD